MTKLHAKWLAALRSGDYEQATGQLKVPELRRCFCALGVLADVAVRNGLGMWEGCRFVSEDAPDHAWLMALPQVLLPDDLQTQVTEFNDTERLSFSDIADKLEPLL